MKLAELFESTKYTPEQAEQELLKTKGVTSVDVEKQFPGTYVHFKFKGNDFSLRFTKSGVDLYVQGYADSIEMQDGVESTIEVMNLVKGVNKSWFKEYDPDYDD